MCPTNVLLFRWRGSIYKLVWKDFALFATIYFLLTFLYRFILDKPQKKYAFAFSTSILVLSVHETCGDDVKESRFE